jgi:hypothetical protein
LNLVDVGHKCGPEPLLCILQPPTTFIFSQTRATFTFILILPQPRPTFLTGCQNSLLNMSKWLHVNRFVQQFVKVPSRMRTQCLLQRSTSTKSPQSGLAEKPAASTQGQSTVTDTSTAPNNEYLARSDFPIGFLRDFPMFYEEDARYSMSTNAPQSGKAVKPQAPTTLKEHTASNSTRNWENPRSLTPSDFPNGFLWDCPMLFEDERKG